MFIPGDAAELDAEGMFVQGVAQKLAILLNGVGRFVPAPQQSDDTLRAHFSMRKLPMTNASMPEL
jgi:hypothetical protein